MKIIAAIEDPQVIKKILSHLGLPTKAPAIYTAAHKFGDIGLNERSQVTSDPTWIVLDSFEHVGDAI